ncbi:RNA 2',3'-cyclic phosphodiesterase [Paenibacillus sp. FJAT-27812]|uniref:RNA 2',3'-cyclic phosphodiesterase n=1 Tax=Paenibacillus sp. FJAT-27812 TaxID=1684143 RepID=UPI0006A7EFD0|nr:RNA 2',3'-cyclic phosphodiesterase [Paenibacillus sp. FJAT-27812]
MGQGNVNGQKQRLFIAIPVPEPIAKLLADWTLVHKEKLPFRKWTHPRDYHITLQFLGDTTAAQHEMLLYSLREVKGNPLTLALNGAGTFGKPESPRVLWAAVGGDVEPLTALQAEVVKATRTANFEPEERTFRPHLTLAKGFAGGLLLSNETLSSIPSFEWEADRFVLMRTHMNASPMYEVISDFPL